MTDDDHALARELAEEAGRRLLELRAGGGFSGEPDLLRKAGDRQSHEFLTAELARRRPGDVVLSEEGADDPALPAQGRVLSTLDPPPAAKEANGAAAAGTPGSSASTGRLRIVVSRTRAPR